MGKLFSVLVLLYFNISFSQSINDYKYVIVPSQFDFTNEPDEYRLNTITKSILERSGFIAFFDTDNMPTEVVDSNCNKLYADLKSEGSFSRTKLVLYLRDCKRNIIYSAQGENKEKEYAVTYNLAIRDIGKDMSTLPYKYNGKSETQSTIIVKEPTPVKFEKIGTGTLFAQPIANGFQLVDDTPKVVLRLYNTSNAEVFIAKKNLVKGTVSKKNGVWIFEYYIDDKLVTETLDIKF